MPGAHTGVCQAPLGGRAQAGAFHLLDAHVQIKSAPHNYVYDVHLGKKGDCTEELAQQLEQDVVPDMPDWQLHSIFGRAAALLQAILPSIISTTTINVQHDFYVRRAGHFPCRQGVLC